MSSLFVENNHLACIYIFFFWEREFETGVLYLHHAHPSLSSLQRLMYPQLPLNYSLSITFTYKHVCVHVYTCMCICVLQNSPELDEEGYSIRPEEPGYILPF